MLTNKRLNVYASVRCFAWSQAAVWTSRQVCASITTATIMTMMAPEVVAMIAEVVAMIAEVVAMAAEVAVMEVDVHRIPLVVSFPI